MTQPTNDLEALAAKQTLAECPIGLFMCGDELCLKTEYGNNEGRIDAYIVSSGEFFWGDAPQTIASQRAQMVTPVDGDAVLTALRAQDAVPVTTQPANDIEALAAVFEEAESMSMTMRRRKIFNAGKEALTALRAQDAVPVVVERDPFLWVLAALDAATSILDRAHKEGKQPKLVVGSDKMFKQMQADYAKALKAGRDALNHPSPNPAPQAVAADGDDERWQKLRSYCTPPPFWHNEDGWRTIIRMLDAARPTDSNGDKDAVIAELRAENVQLRGISNELIANHAVNTATIAALREALEKIYNLPGELNLANYNEDDVRELNENFVAAILTAEQALATKPTGELSRGEAGE